jgi:hypothetical protein
MVVGRSNVTVASVPLIGETLRVSCLIKLARSVETKGPSIRFIVPMVESVNLTATATTLILPKDRARRKTMLKAQRKTRLDAATSNRAL